MNFFIHLWTLYGQLASARIEKMSEGLTFRCWKNELRFSPGLAFVLACTLFRKKLPGLLRVRSFRPVLPYEFAGVFRWHLSVTNSRDR